MVSIKAAAAAALLSCCALVQQTAAQTSYPNRVVTIVSPTAPGGSYSIYAQLIALGLEKRLGKPVIVENKPGAGTVIGTNLVAKAEPDGHTMLLGASPGLAINVTTNKSLPYDVLKDFIPVSLFAMSPQVLMVNAALPIHSVADIARIAKEKPGSLTFASNGPGTVMHLSGEMMKRQLGIDIMHVPYKGAAPALNDVMGGHVSMVFTSLASAGAMVNSDKTRIIGLTTTDRIETLPSVRPLAEIGMPGFDSSLWYMVVVPAKTPKEIVDKLHHEIGVVTSEPEVRKKIVELGAIAIKSPPLAELQTFLKSEIERWGKVVQAAGLAGTM